jgi:hypothetical protein
VSLPVAPERQAPRRDILPKVEPVVRHEPRRDDTEDNRESATFQLPQTGT